MALPLLLASIQAMTPYTSSPQQEDEIQFSNDKHFALHGKIMLIVLVLAFFLFIVFILMIPCLKRARTHKPEGYQDSIADQNCPSQWFRRRRNDDLTREASSPSNSEVSRKFPL